MIVMGAGWAWIMAVRLTRERRFADSIAPFANPHL